MSGLSQQFCVRWNSHLGSLGAAFPQLLAGQRFVDVTLACEGHQVHCHRLVLAACSTYFENLLGENPCKHPIIILPRDIKLWEIQALVDFMYKGEVNVSQAGLPDLLKCAETLKIRGLCGSDASLNLNQITSPNSNSNSVTPIPAQTDANISLHNSGQNNTNTNPALAKSILSARLSDPKQAKTVNNLQPTAPTINPHTASTTIKHVQPLVLDDGENSDNGSGNEMCIKTEELIIDEDACKRDDDEDEEIEMETTEKSQTEFAMANVTCEYDSNTMQLMDSSSGGRRVRRSEAILKQAADCVSRGETFQTVSDMFHIPISTIRFYMARKGILPRRKRGRTAIIPFVLSTGSNSTNQSNNSNINQNTSLSDQGTSGANSQAHQNSSRSSSPTDDLLHFANYKLPVFSTTSH